MKQKSERSLKSRKGITLIALVVTIIILIILAGVSLYLILGQNGIIKKATIADQETVKQTATEAMNLKITSAQINTYAEKQEMPTLQELADKFCNDNDFEYVELQSKKVASLPQINVGTNSSIFTKLKEYPYEFEINSLLQLASIDGVQVATAQATTNSNTNNTTPENNYSVNEQVIGTWIDGKPLYQKTLQIQLPGTTSSSARIIDLDISDLNIDGIYNYSAVMCTNGSKHEFIFVPFFIDDGANWGSIAIWDDIIRFIYKNNAAIWGTGKVFITIQYTKIPESAQEE